MTNRRFLPTLTLASVLAGISILLVACAEEPKPAPEPAKEAEKAPAPPAETPPAEAAKEPEIAKEPEAAKPAPPKPARQSLLNPSTLTAKAPDTFKVKFETSKGDILIEVDRSWAPRGVDRFYNLVKNGFYNEARFFRVLSNFVVQFGMNADPRIAQVWSNAQLKDDPVLKTNRKGALTFAMAGPNTRTTQVFINLKANAFLDSQGFAPFGQVVEGMDVVESLYSGYGEGPDQAMILNQGNAYLNRQFPKLDYIKKATIM